MEKEPKEILSVRIDSRLLAKVDALVERTGVGRAEIVERCLTVGLQDEEVFVEWLESRWKGPFASMLFHPKLVGVVMKVMGDPVDPIQMKIRENLNRKRKGGPADGK